MGVVGLPESKANSAQVKLPTGAELGKNQGKMKGFEWVKLHELALQINKNG